LAGGDGSVSGDSTRAGSDEASALYAALQDERDLPCVLLSASFLDRCMAGVLAKHFTKSSVSDKLLDPRAGFLGTFAARADVCYSLGLVSKPFYQNLMTIASLRNMLAHSHLTLSFAAAEVSALCFRLHTPPFIAGGCDIRAKNDDEYQGLCRHARDRFTVVVTLMANQLINLEARCARCTPAEDWWS